MNTKINRILWPAILFIVLVALWALAVRFFDAVSYTHLTLPTKA